MSGKFYKTMLIARPVRHECTGCFGLLMGNRLVWGRPVAFARQPPKVVVYLSTCQQIDRLRNEISGVNVTPAVEIIYARFTQVDRIVSEH